MISKAKITAKEGFRIALNGHTVTTFAFGEIVTGRTADKALASHSAQRMLDPVQETKVVAPKEKKVKRNVTKTNR